MKAPSAACASADGAFVVTKDKKNPGPRADRGNRHRERFSEWVSRPVRAQAIGGVPEGARRLRDDHPQRGTEIRRPATGTARRLTAQRDEKEERPSAESSD